MNGQHLQGPALEDSVGTAAAICLSTSLPPIPKGREQQPHTLPTSDARGKQVPSVDPKDKMPGAPEEDNISDSRDNCLPDASSTALDNFKLTLSLWAILGSLLSSHRALFPISSSLALPS